MHNTLGLKPDIVPHGHVTLRFRSVQVVATTTSKEIRQTVSVLLERKKFVPRWDSNPQPLDYETDAPLAELRRLLTIMVPHIATEI